MRRGSNIFSCAVVTTLLLLQQSESNAQASDPVLERQIAVEQGLLPAVLDEGNQAVSWALSERMRFRGFTV
jgi:hypothetical protein